MFSLPTLGSAVTRRANHPNPLNAKVIACGNLKKTRSMKRYQLLTSEHLSLVSCPVSVSRASPVEGESVKSSSSSRLGVEPFVPRWHSEPLATSVLQLRQRHTLGRFVFSYPVSLYDRGNVTPPLAWCQGLIRVVREFFDSRTRRMAN